MTALLLDDIWIYTGVSVILVMAFCCCFNIFELVKLGYLKKLTSPDRFSLSGASTTELEGSRWSSAASSRRESERASLEPGLEKSPVPFAMFTVIALPPAIPVDERGVLEEDTAERAMDEMLGEITSSCSRFGTSSQTDDPPKYESLFASSQSLV